MSPAPTRQTRNLALLCRFHRHQHHDAVFDITANSDGTLTFRRPDGTVIPQIPTPRANDDESTTQALRATATLNHVNTDAATSQWRGERFDRHYIVGLLATSRNTEGPRVRDGMRSH